VEWSLSIPDEPAELRYSLPYAVFASVLPEVRVGGPVAIFGEAGAGLGRVKEIKTASATSAYREDKMRGAMAFGGGISVSVGPRASVYADWRRVSYRGFEYDSFDPAGARVEHVKDAPTAGGFTVGVTTSF
jgi:opacity protein-like surface antigen